MWQFNHAAWQTRREVGCGRPEGVRPGWLHGAAEDRKHVRCSTCGQVTSVLSEQGQIRARQQASTQTTIHVRSNRIDGPFIFVSHHRLWYLHYARTYTFLASPGSDGSGRLSRPVFGLASRQFEVVPSGPGFRKAAAGGRAQPKRRERRNGNPRMMVPQLEEGGRVRRKEDDARARGAAAAAP